MDVVLRLFSIPILALTLVGGCESDAGTIIVDLKTDYVAGAEFSAVRTSLFTGVPIGEEVPLARQELGVSFGSSFITGGRVAELTLVGSGAVVLRTELIAADGRIVTSRVSRMEVSSGNSAITVLISRDCEGIVCPNTGAPAEATECYGSRCVAPDCVEETVAECGPPTCTRDDECMSAVACAEGRCVAGACLLEGISARCGAGEYCAPTVGCRMLPGMDGGMDAATDTGGGPVDASTDTATLPDSSIVDAPSDATGDMCPMRGAACDIVGTMMVDMTTRELFLDVMYTNGVAQRGSCGGAAANEYSALVQVLQTGDYLFEVAGSDMPVTMYARTSPCASGTELDCIYDPTPGPGGPGFTLSGLTAGTDVYIIMDGDGACGAASFRVTAL